MTKFMNMPKSPLRDALQQCSQLANDYDALLVEAQELVLFNSTGGLWFPDHLKKHQEMETRLRAKGEDFEKSLRQYNQVKGDKR